jgi:hypothetical protein
MEKNIKNTFDNFTQAKLTIIEGLKSKNVHQCYLDEVNKCSGPFILEMYIIDAIDFLISCDVTLPNGHYKNLHKEFNVSEGKVNGLFIQRSNDGMIFSQIVFENSKCNGAFITFHPDGKLQAIWHCVNDELDGVLKEFDENGVLVRHEIWKEGEQIETIV